MICPNCKQTNVADAVFCQHCGTRLKVRCQHCGTVNALQARFCINCGSALGAVPEPANPAVSEDSTSLPTRSERRVVTILFADIKGSTSLAEKLDPEEWAEIMNVTFNRMTRAVTRYEGTVARLMGDAILALFGAPHAHEDDPYRAILAAVDILDDLKPYQDEIRLRMDRLGHQPEPTDFDVRIGINTGLAVVGEIGTRPFVEYTAMGDAVNMAARLEQAAAPGSVLMSAETYRQVSHLIEVEPLGAIEMKGKTGRFRTYQLVRQNSKNRLARRTSVLQAPLIGREAEILKLKELAGRLHAGTGFIVSLIGEAGLGKSRLVEELRSAEAVRDLNWIEATSLSFETNQPYGLLKRLLQKVLNISAEDNTAVIAEKIKEAAEQGPAEDRNAVRRALDALFATGTEQGRSLLQGEALQREMFEGIRRFWKHRIAITPTAFVVDDLHWADPASVDLILHLLDLAVESPVLFLLIYRPEHQSHAWVFREQVIARHQNLHLEIVLNPLTDDESQLLVRELLRESNLPATVTARILRKSEGNPFFVEEILHELIENGSLVSEQDDQGWQLAGSLQEIDIPDSLEALLVSRLDRLDTDARRTAQLAAVIGRTFYYRVLKLVSERSEDIDRSLDVLQQYNLILESAQRPELEYMFRHVLTQEAAYNTILLSRRREFHQQTGEVMERLFADRLEAYAPLLAHHFLCAGDTARAFRYFVMAAEAASNLFANHEAVSHYNEVLELVNALPDLPPETRVRVLLGRGSILDTQGAFENAVDDLDGALRTAREHGLAFEEWKSLLSLGKLWASRDYNRSGEIFNQALVLARKLGDPVALATSLNRLGNWYLNRDLPRDAVRYHQEALKIFEGQQDEPGKAETLDLLCMASLLSADLVSSAAYHLEAIRIFRKIDHQTGIVSSLTAYGYRGPNYQSKTAYPAETLDKVLAEAGSEIELARKINWKAGESWAAWGIALSYGARGFYGRAIDLAQDGIRIADEIQHRQWMSGSRTSLGAIYFDLLNYERAIAEFEEARALGIEVDSWNWIRTSSGPLARSYIWTGRLREAEELLDDVLPDGTPMETVGQRNSWLAMAELRIAKNLPNDGLAIADALVETAPSRPDDGVITQLWLLRAKALEVLGREQEAEDLLQAAVEHGRQFGEIPLLWRIEIARGRVLDTLGKKLEASEARAEARQIVELLAEEAPAGPVRDVFLERARALVGGANPGVC